MSDLLDEVNQRLKEEHQIRIKETPIASAIQIGMQKKHLNPEQAAEELWKSYQSGDTYIKSIFEQVS
ncbi:MAG: hypothetical protein ABIG37_00920 [Nanoarchaeota archaeon]|nr:hypothetical protein [Nanoarchaeota archaeon]